MRIDYHSAQCRQSLSAFLRALPGILWLVPASIAAAVSGTDPGVTGPERIGYQRAAAYSRAHRGLSMVIVKDGQVVFEDYPDGHDADEAHNLYSGTKSFSCAIAVAAVEDRLLDFDEPVAQTITEWWTDARKATITVRQLLSLTSGIHAAGGVIRRALSYADAIHKPLRHPPGTTFEYGPVPFQVFGELMHRKLAATGEDPRAYLTRRVLRPIGITVDSWKTGPDGNPRLFGGASLTARVGQVRATDPQRRPVGRATGPGRRLAGRVLQGFGGESGLWSRLLAPGTRRHRLQRPTR
ncbi:MAG TPA: serine hydrolase domain-containing protein [Acidiferrobacterales bacterium]